MQLSFRYRFESAHRFVGADSPRCQTPHGHTWWVKLDIKTMSDELNSNWMVEEFTELKKNWRSFIDNTVDHSFFHHRQDPLLPAFRDFVPNFRGLPFPGDPTTEMVAILFLAKAEAMIDEHNKRRGTNLRAASVLIDETPTNSVQIQSETRLYIETLKKISQDYTGWWSTTDVDSRDLVLIKE